MCRMRRDHDVVSHTLVPSFALVARARAIQTERYGALGLTVRTNAQVASAVLEAIVKPDAGGLALLRDASEAMRLSARGYHLVLRVARTLADLDGEDAVRRVHLAEALAYRAVTYVLRRAAYGYLSAQPPSRTDLNR